MISTRLQNVHESHGFDERRLQLKQRAESAKNGCLSFMSCSARLVLVVAIAIAAIAAAAAAAAAAEVAVLLPRWRLFREHLFISSANKTHTRLTLLKSLPIMLFVHCALGECALSCSSRQSLIRLQTSNFKDLIWSPSAPVQARCPRQLQLHPATRAHPALSCLGQARGNVSSDGQGACAWEDGRALRPELPICCNMS